MNEKKIGIALIISAIALTLISVSVKIYYFTRASLGYPIFVIIWFMAGTMGAVGFIMRSSELERHIGESQLKVNKELLEAKVKERQKESFLRFLDGFSSDEKEVIEFLHTYEGARKVDIEKIIPKSESILKKLQAQKALEILPNGKIYLKRLSP